MKWAPSPFSFWLVCPAGCMGICPMLAAQWFGVFVIFLGTYEEARVVRAERFLAEPAAVEAETCRPAPAKPQERGKGRRKKTVTFVSTRSR